MLPWEGAPDRSLVGEKGGLERNLNAGNAYRPSQTEYFPPSENPLCPPMTYSKVQIHSTASNEKKPNAILETCKSPKDADRRFERAR